MAVKIAAELTGVVMETNNNAIRNFKGIWIPKNIYLNQNLSWTEKILLIEIDNLDNDRGCFASNKHFAKFLNVKENTVSIYIKHLKELGFVEQISFDGRTRVLKVNQELFTTTPKFIEPENENKNKVDKNQLDLFLFNDLKNSNTSFEKTQTDPLKKVKEPNIYINNTANSPINNNKKDKSFLGKNAEEDNSEFLNKNKQLENHINIIEKTKEEKNKIQEKTNSSTQSEKDINKQIFGFGIILLNDAGIKNKEARRIIGKWLRTNSRIDVLRFIKEALEKKIFDPVSWITKQLQKQAEDYKQKQMKKALEEASKCKKEQSSLPDSLYPELKTIKDKITKLNKWKDNGDIIIDDELLNSLTKEERELLLESTSEEYGMETETEYNAKEKYNTENNSNFNDDKNTYNTYNQ